MLQGNLYSLEAQIASKMHELIDCICVVNFKNEGDRRINLKLYEGVDS
jgi:hypothetical protein